MYIILRQHKCFSILYWPIVIKLYSAQGMSKRACFGALEILVTPGSGLRESSCSSVMPFWFRGSGVSFPYGFCVIFLDVAPGALVPCARSDFLLDIQLLQQYPHPSLQWWSCLHCGLCWYVRSITRWLISPCPFAERAGAKRKSLTSARVCSEVFGQIASILQELVVIPAGFSNFSFTS